MRESIATITTFALAALTYTPSNSALASTSPVLAELLVEDSSVESGYDVTLAVTRAPEGDVIGDATVVDPTTGDEVDMWTDGVTVAWVGVVDGAPTAGEMAVADLEIGNHGMAAAWCFAPVTALVCIGAAALLFSSTGCAHFINCVPRSGTANPCDSGACEPPPFEDPGDGGGGDSSDDGED
jgi:hypothetical protein